MTSSHNSNLGRDPSQEPCQIHRDEEPLFLAIKLYLSFLQGLFGQLPERTYRWDPHIENSEIIITDQVPVKIEEVARVPHIVTIRAPAQSADLALDHRVGGTAQDRRHMDLITTTITMNCIAREGLVAQRVAYLCYWGLKRYRRVLMRGTHIHETGKQLMVSGETPPGSLVSGDADPGPVMVSVTSPTYLRESWSITENIDEYPILKSIQATLNVIRDEDVVPQGPASEECGGDVEFSPPMYRGSRLVHVADMDRPPGDD